MIVTQNSQLPKVLAFIAENEVLAYDTETNSLNPRTGVVIGFGISNDTTGFYIPIRVFDRVRECLNPTNLDYNLILQALAHKKLVMWNSSFDIRFTKNNLGIDLLPALACDGMLLKHTCDENYPFGLKEVATKLYGTDAKKEKEEMQESVKSNGGTAKQYYKASTEVLGRYCIQDCLLTYRLYNHYTSDLRRQGLHNFFYQDEVLPLYKEVVIPMEETGVALDVPKLQAAQAGIAKDLKELEDRIQFAIEPHLAIFTKWFLDKDYPLVSYTTKKPSAWTKKYSSQLAAWQASSEGCYMFNLQSKHHLKKLFFDTLQIEPLSRTPTGLPQVDEEFLDSIVEQQPWVKYLIEYNKLNKLKSTYIDRLLEEQEAGVFYPSWKQHGTVSGRLSGDLQQLPRTLEPGQASELIVKYTNMVREFIVPFANERLISADYEQLEPTIFSHTSGDSRLQSIFNSGLDFYSEVAIGTESLKGISSNKSDASYLGKVNKPARQKAKAYALGIAYGMTSYKLKFELNVSESEAERLVRDYLNAFPDLKAWIQGTHKHVKIHGQVATQTGRIRHLQQARAIFRKWGTPIEDDLQLWKAYNADGTMYAKAKEDRKIYKNLLNNSVNFQVQGLAASIVNKAMIEVSRAIKAKNYKAKVVGSIHDEIILSAPLEELDDVCKFVKSIMENIVPLAVPLRTVPQTGVNYRECK